MNLTDSMRSGAWQVQSRLLAYPDEGLLDSLSLLCRTVAALPEPIGAPLQPLLNHLERGVPLALATEYIETFGHPKRFKQLYRTPGLVLDNGELSDHLAVVLEFAAAFPEPGERLLSEHRAGIEVMRMALREAGSPWMGVLESLSATLPALRADEHQAIAELIAQGLRPLRNPIRGKAIRLR
ncbi:nitrate reductase molybdenum cofactor assembly chaperone [Nocardia sp. SYP-A9097]|uniref:nitrate reductase molybdenum cofactor assembly chaperone n=1 Tax=Nocardia sp. SYP-A9097 TaxID=2663237 RepID=UPI00129B5F64|nr:molecular chaperone TorD family protein [Nocardia sp. SYP-A9097]MRH90548.1 nitrate reductase molybdenum cofactor assembly chaperone [Nocardia sp. SYP-A9097]